VSLAPKAASRAPQSAWQVRMAGSQFRGTALQSRKVASAVLKVASRAPKIVGKFQEVALAAGKSGWHLLKSPRENQGKVWHFQKIASMVLATATLWLRLAILRAQALAACCPLFHSAANALGSAV